MSMSERDADSLGVRQGSDDEAVAQAIENVFHDINADIPEEQTPIQSKGEFGTEIVLVEQELRALAGVTMYDQDKLTSLEERVTRLQVYAEGNDLTEDEGAMLYQLPMYIETFRAGDAQEFLAGYDAGVADTDADVA